MELSLGAAKKGRWRSLGALLFSAFVLAVLCAEWLLVVQPARVNNANSQRSRYVCSPGPTLLGLCMGGTQQRHCSAAGWPSGL